jgi:hypothetical protein
LANEGIAKATIRWLIDDDEGIIKATIRWLANEGIIKVTIRWLINEGIIKVTLTLAGDSPEDQSRFHE